MATKKATVKKSVYSKLPQYLVVPYHSSPSMVGCGDGAEFVNDLDQVADHLNSDAWGEGAEGLVIDLHENKIYYAAVNVLNLTEIK